jgi:glutathione S-transferase
MEYITCAEARGRPGLRLVLSRGAPGPWGEAAKSVFKVRKVPFVAVGQQGMGDNDDLFAWTGQRNAPVAMYEDERPRHTAIDLLYLAERIGSGPSLLPQSRALQVECIGLVHQLCNEDGLGWNRRLNIWSVLLEEAGGDWTKTTLAPRAFRDYDGRPEALARATDRLIAILEMLQTRLLVQQASGCKYFVGDQLTAADINFATMFGMLDPLPPELCASPERSRRLYSSGDARVRAAVTPELKAHRDFIYQAHLKLPMDF